LSYLSRSVESTGERRSAYKILAGKPKGKKPLGRPRRTMDLKTLDGKVQAGLIWLRTGSDLWWAHGNEPSGIITCWEFLDY
jgi:hypothetical protein